MCDRLDFHRKIVSVSLEKYRELPKRGKPKTEQEWTPLSTFVQSSGRKGMYHIMLKHYYCTSGGELSVVSLGTGSKCIGEGKMSREGQFASSYSVFGCE